jgi:carbon storage regulator CsrA
MALVLSRKEGEEIVLVEAGVTIRIEDIKGNRVQVSIEAPKDVRVMRREIMNQPPRKEQA